MVGISADIIGIKELVKSLNDVDIEQANAERIQKMTFIVLGEVKKETPVDTGFLRNRIKSKFSFKQGEVFTKVPYAMSVHEGTRPHTIRVRSKRVLSNGKSFFGTSVNHPGTKANPFFDRGLDSARGRSSNLYTKILNKFISSAGFE